MKHISEDRHFRSFGEEDFSLVGTLADEAASSAALPPPRLAMVGCYSPRKCGIATFTADTCRHLDAARPDLPIDIYAMQSLADPATDAEVTRAIRDDVPADYRAAAAAINASGATVVWLQHEFGIFGGAAGEMIFELVDRIAAPLIVTLHTVLAEPAPQQRRVVDRLVARASTLVVMSEHARTTLIDTYGADRAQIALIEHGTPDRSFNEISKMRRALGLAERPVLSTFGLIGPGKGLEASIRALPAIAAQYPDILYRIVGATHPNLIAHEGEAYRDGLVALADSLGVSENIAWENRFLDTEDLLDQIELCDIYLAPYPNLEQVTSGTLAYAVALGRAVISTPFVHARELLAGEAGILLPSAESEAIAEAVRLLLAVPEERRALQRRAYARGRRTAWGAIAEQCAALIETVSAPAAELAARRGVPALGGVWAMCDDVGMFQHAILTVPDRRHGYCIDDNARALMLVSSLPPRLQAEMEHRALAFASFIQHGWNEDLRCYRNFMGYDRCWREDAGSEDSNGRTLWALGHAAARARPVLRQWASAWFARTAGIALEFENPRALAFAILGADEYLAHEPDHRPARAIIERGGALLASLWKSARRSGWDWFEPGLAYDNARLAEALMRAGRRLGSLPLEQAGLDALGWLADFQTAPEGHFRPVGSESFGREGEALPFDQQPLEAWATVDACASAFALTSGEVWRCHAETAYSWFLGRNDRGAALGDLRSGRCHDGLGPREVNRNCGAESILAFHLAHRTMADIFWRDAAPTIPEWQADDKRPALVD
ncbi:glycosyltransferase [Sphingopyxis sp. PAMC25046]|uniref:glycosyltransferase family 4 protein n=1 Tax=Sphingopyxis sp. PAMC25046 TaxID=2565556 RepID=UPI00109D9237|nr:glycosyltransferase family 4 protein [Sphingopyxis sp. PAMC25046]QCB55737.1 glycosyltransferase [Sphingopyxis sp. PAMC25046]